MDKLKGMTEYVLQVANENTWPFLRRFQAVENYARFLSQPLALGMFVPCSLEGEVLEEPYHLDYKTEKYKGEFTFISESHKRRYSDTYDAYQAAKEVVLFEVTIKKRGEQFLRFQSVGRNFIEYDLITNQFLGTNHSIQDLATKSYDLLLTESAKKKINS